LDECGVCGGSGIDFTNSCDCYGRTLDCGGVCGGHRVLDECGECEGDGIDWDEGECDCNHSVIDVCGVCGGDGV
jgi:hypothetical protein